jgi:hypothetical protein
MLKNCKGSTTANGPKRLTYPTEREYLFTMIKRADNASNSVSLTKELGEKVLTLLSTGMVA